MASTEYAVIVRTRLGGNRAEPQPARRAEERIGRAVGLPGVNAGPSTAGAEKPGEPG